MRKLAPSDSTAAVDRFMTQLDHPQHALVEQLRRVILAVDPRIAEGVKWNAPSYRTSEYFATTNLRSKQGIGVILHLGAKARALPAGGLSLDDPGGLLRWLAADRASIEFEDSADLKRKRTAFIAILRQWIEHV